MYACIRLTVDQWAKSNNGQEYQWAKSNNGQRVTMGKE